MARAAAFFLLAVGLLALLAGCGSASGEACPAAAESGTGKLEPSAVRPALRVLPYRVRIRRIKGPARNTASFRGTARGPRGTAVDFSIGVGDPPQAIPVKPLGIQNVAHEDASGFAYNDNAWPTEFESALEWKIAARMSVDIWEALCKAATGDPCPV